MKRSRIILLAALCGALLFSLGLFAACAGGSKEHEHVYRNWETLVPATCTEGGSERAKCTVCGEETVRPTDPLGHDMVKTGGTAATCTEEGSEARKCSRCGAEETVTLDPLGHLWSASTPTVRLLSAAKCEEDGERVVTCERCGEEVNVPIPALGHSWAEEETVLSEPTCTEDGSRLATCVRCKTEGSVRIPALGHDWETAYTIDRPATFEEAGERSRHCSRCEEVTDRTEIPKLEEGRPTQYAFRLVRTNGELLEISGGNGADIKGHVVDAETGEEAGTFTIRKGKAVAALLPKSYYVTVEGVPAGYTAKERYEVDWSDPTCDMVLTGALIEGEAPAGTSYAKGSVMHDFSVTAIAMNGTSGGTVKLSELLAEKQMVMLNFWYIGCQFCRYEFPGMEAAYKQYAEDVAIIAVDPNDESVEAIRAFAESCGLTFYVAKDDAGLAAAFKVGVFPTTVVIDREGVVSEIHASALVNPADYADLAYCTQRFCDIFEKYAKRKD